VSGIQLGQLQFAFKVHVIWNEVAVDILLASVGRRAPGPRNLVAPFANLGGGIVHPDYLDRRHNGVDGFTRQGDLASFLGYLAYGFRVGPLRFMAQLDLARFLELVNQVVALVDARPVWQADDLPTREIPGTILGVKEVREPECLEEFCLAQ